MNDEIKRKRMSSAAAALQGALGRLEAQVSPDHHLPVWEDQIAFNTQDEPEFAPLPRASELGTRESWTIELAALNLPHSVDHYLALDAAPIPAPNDRVGYYGHRHFEYWVSGLQHHQIVVGLMERYGVNRHAIIDFGSASGRAIRHMAAYESFRELWAIDLDWRHIAWIQRFLPRSIRAIHTCAVPHLPIEDGSVDCVMAWSVFTHVGSFETAWLAELRRVLRPGGLALLTALTEGQLVSMTPNWPMYKPFVEHPRWHAGFGEELKQRGKIVLRIGDGRGYAAHVIYDTNYLHDTWGSLFKILEHKREYPRFQDLLVLQKA